MLTLRLALPSLSLVALLVGCSEAPSDFIACELGQLHVEGDIDGTAVSLTQSTENSGFAQSDTGGGFWIGDLPADPTRMDLTIDWAPGIVDGKTANVTAATLVMPSEPATLAFAGQTFFAGAGSQIRIPKKSENTANLQFNLTSLTVGTEARTGTLRGCWRPDRTGTN